MSDFLEIMHQWSRMCEKHMCSEKEHPTYGDICPIILERSIYFSCSDCVTDMSHESLVEVERIVGEWASAHPEPVYPTWADYITMKMLEDITERNDTTPQTLGTWMGKTNIPADIAEKLGLQPKEA